MATYDVTDQTTARRVQFTGNGTAGPFAFSFQVNATSEVKVYVDSTEKTETSHYTVTLNSSTGAGTISFTTGNHPTSSETITILGDIPLSRTSVYTSGGQFTASSLESDFDTNMFIHQQTNEEINRSLRLAEHDVIASADMTLPVKDTRKGKLLGFNETTGNPEATFTTADGQTLSNIASDIATLADIEDGTDATDAIQTVAGIASNVSTVASISSNVTSVASNSSNINTVAGKASLITSDFASDMALIDSTFVSKINLVTSDFIADMAVVTSDFISDLNSLATTSIIADLDALATSDFISDLNAVEAIKANVTSVANNTSNINSAVSNATNINAVAGAITNVNNVGGSIANVNTVASNLSGVNSFAERYRVGSSDPSSDNDAGDLFFNTSDNTFKFFDGSSYQAVNVTGIGNVVEDTTPQLGGNLDVNGNSIVSTSDGNIAITPNGSGKVVLDGLSYPDSDGTNGQVITTNGSGVLSFGTVDLSVKANIASPTFTGTPAGPTASAGTNTTQLATTAFVTTAVANAEPFPSGTSMLFQQTSAPTGWTKQTTHDDKALRIVTGSVGTGGSVAFSTALGSGATVAGGSVSGSPDASSLSVSISGNISNTTLSNSNIPSHSHSFSTSQGGADSNVAVGRRGPVNHNLSTSNTGSGGSHNHGHNLSGSMSGNIGVGNLAVGASTATINVNYVDFIIANKD